MYETFIDNRFLRITRIFTFFARSKTKMFWGALNIVTNKRQHNWKQIEENNGLFIFHIETRFCTLDTNKLHFTQWKNTFIRVNVDQNYKIICLSFFWLKFQEEWTFEFAMNHFIVNIALNAQTLSEYWFRYSINFLLFFESKQFFSIILHIELRLDTKDHLILAFCFLICFFKTILHKVIHTKEEKRSQFRVNDWKWYSRREIVV